MTTTRIVKRGIFLAPFDVSISSLRRAVLEGDDLLGNCAGLCENGGRLHRDGLAQVGQGDVLQCGGLAQMVALVTLQRQGPGELLARFAVTDAGEVGVSELDRIRASARRCRCRELGCGRDLGFAVGCTGLAPA